MLVEAGMPDHLLFIVKENPPLLLLDVPADEQSPHVAKHLIETRRGAVRTVWRYRDCGDH